MKKYLTLILALFGWAVSNVHRWWNDKPVDNVDWFIFIDKKQDVQWYICDTGNMLFTLCLAIIILLWVKGTIKLICWGVLFCQILDLISYWCWYKHSEAILALQGIIFLILSTITFIRWIGRSKCGSSL